MYAHPMTGSESVPLINRKASGRSTGSRWSMVASGAACIALAGCVGAALYLKNPTNAVNALGTTAAIPTEGVPFQFPSSNLDDEGTVTTLDMHIDGWGGDFDRENEDNLLYHDADTSYFASGSVMIDGHRGDVNQAVRDQLAREIAALLPNVAPGNIKVGFVHDDDVLDRFATMDSKAPLSTDWATRAEEVEFLTPVEPMRAYFSPYSSAAEEEKNGKLSVAFTVEAAHLPTAEHAHATLEEHLGRGQQAIQQLGSLNVTSTDVHPHVMDEIGGLVTTCASEAAQFTAEALKEFDAEEEDVDSDEESDEDFEDKGEPEAVPTPFFVDPAEDTDGTKEARDLISGALGGKKYYGPQKCKSTEYTGCSTESCMHGKCVRWPDGIVDHFKGKVDLDNSYCRDIGGWGRTACFTESGNIGMCAVNNCDKKATDRSCRGKKAVKSKKGRKKNKKLVKPRYTKRKAAIAWLEAHNTFRCMHGVPMLKWNNNLAKHSMDWGIEAKAQMKHSTGQARDGKTLKKQYPKDKVIKKFSYAGENLCWGSPRPQGPAKCTKAWYDEIQFAPGNGRGPMVGPQTISGPLAVPRGKFPPEWFPGGAPKVKNYGAVYEYWKGDSSKTTGHYTQVIWKEATHVGCATYKGLDVCQYGSISGTAGNMGGRFKANVKPLKKKNMKCRKQKMNKPKSDLPKS